MTIQVYASNSQTTTQATPIHIPINHATPVTAVALPKLKLTFTPEELQPLIPHLLKLKDTNLDYDPKVFEKFIAQKQQS